MSLGSFLRRIKVDLVPGWPVTAADALRPRRMLFGSISPLTLFGRWRVALSPLVPPEAFVEAGLENLREVYPGKYDRQLVVMQCLHSVLVQRIPGTVAEFGCFRGHTAIHMARMMRKAGDASLLYLFDSFAGLPPSPRSEDSSWRPGDLAADADEVQERLAAFSNVQIVVGLFEETLRSMPPVAVKFAHVDADLYTSTHTVNGWLLDRITVGGIVVYDDYGFEHCPGVKKAVDEEVATREDFLGLYWPTGQYVAVKLPPRLPASPTS